MSPATKSKHLSYKEQHQQQQHQQQLYLQQQLNQFSLLKAMHILLQSVGWCIHQKPPSIDHIYHQVQTLLLFGQIKQNGRN